MKPPPAWTLREASRLDHPIVQALLGSARWKHQHLDWNDSLALLGKQPFLIAAEWGSPLACLACPPDPPTAAWLRLFAVAAGQDLNRLWQALWPAASERLQAAGVRTCASLVLHGWLAPLLEKSGFQVQDAVIFLEWLAARPAEPARVEGVIRPLHPQDLARVSEVDQAAFTPIWQHPLDTLQDALRQASYATVLEREGRVLAYQISTASAFGAHLARLAVAPEAQGQGLGTALVADALYHFNRRGFQRVSVNTQDANLPARRLYRRLGFSETGQRYPVYVTSL